MQSGKRNSFQTGWYQIRLCDMKAIRDELSTALAIDNKVQWWRILKGVGRILSPAEREAVESIFSKYGIVKVWDC